MKNIYLALVCLIAMTFLISSCKSANTTEPNNTNSGSSKEYFPNSDGNYYKYSTERTDSSGTKSAGTSSTTYSGTKTVGSVTYQNQIDTVTFAGINATSVSFFRKTSGGVYFLFDTTGFSSSITDSALLGYLQYVQISPEMELLQLPITDGASWDVFSLGLKIGAISANIITVKANYVGTEDVTLANSQTIKNAAKVKYDFKITLPNPQNPLQTGVERDYTAYAWFGENIGIVKLQGNGAILGPFTGSGISIGDTTTTVTQTLVSYQVK